MLVAKPMYKSWSLTMITRCYVVPSEANTRCASTQNFGAFGYARQAAMQLHMWSADTLTTEVNSCTSSILQEHHYFWGSYLFTAAYPCRGHLVRLKSKLTLLRELLLNKICLALPLKKSLWGAGAQ